MERVGCEERKDVDKIYSWNRKVGKLSKGGSETYLLTGEFGGTGGRGGGLGLESRGMVWARRQTRWFRILLGGHRGRRRKVRGGEREV
jgi:hypothetical protein